MEGTLTIALGPATLKFRREKMHAFSITTSAVDAINGYGQAAYAVARLAVKDGACRWCGVWRSDLSIVDQIDRRCDGYEDRHRFEQKDHTIAEGYGQTPQEAADSMELALLHYMNEHQDQAG